MIQLIAPLALMAVLLGAGVYGMLARRSAVLVLIGAELVLNAAILLVVIAGTLPAGGLAGADESTVLAGEGDRLLSGQVLAVFVITLAAAEVGVALAVVLLLFRSRGSVDLTRARELGEGFAGHDELPGRSVRAQGEPADSPGWGAMTGGTLASPAAAATVVLPAVASLVFLLGARHRRAAQEVTLLFAAASVLAAGVECWSVLRHGSGPGVDLFGRADTGSLTLVLQIRSDELSAVLAVVVAVVAACVQAYAAAYPTRYPAFAGTVSMFTAAMMLVVHADDAVLLLIGWELMGLASYLLIAHHHERPAARAAAVKAFLVTRIGDVGVLLAVVVLIVSARTTSLSTLVQRAQAGLLPDGVLLLVALLLLAGVVGKSAQFPLHVWLPDAMEGPTPASALIHAATMVAAGTFLLLRLLPVFLAAPTALAVTAVIASISMVGAAVAALVQEDLKRLLAYSTISQVAYMLAGVAMSRVADSGAAAAGLFHLVSHAGFKALLFLVAGCVIHVAGTSRLRDLGGLRRSHPGVALLWALGLAALAGVPPLSGFWSKEAVLGAADAAARQGDWTGWLVLMSGLLTALLTGLYVGRAWSLVALGPGPQEAAVRLPRAMTVPLYVLAVPTVLGGLVLLRPPSVLAGVHVDVATGASAALLALAGIGWAVSAPRLGTPDIVQALPQRLRAALVRGFDLARAQHVLVIAPTQVLARAVRTGERDVVDAYVRVVAAAALAAGGLLRRTQSGLATAYLMWAMVGAVLLALVAATAVMRG